MASEYGWTKNYILEYIYLDDLIYLQEVIKRRRVADWKMQLLIAQNPHLAEEDDRRALWDLLNDNATSRLEATEAEEKVDMAGFEMLKMKMRGNPRIIVK